MKDRPKRSYQDIHALTEDQVMLVLSMPPTERSCELLAPVIKKKSQTIYDVYEVADGHPASTTAGKFNQDLIQHVAGIIGWRKEPDPEERSK